MLEKEKAEIVKKIFFDFVNGASIVALSSEVRKIGFTLRGRSSLTRILTNPIYAGLLKLPAKSGSPEKIIRAIHEPVISEALYWKVQEMIGGRSKLRCIPREDVPLRGIVRCTCGSPLTAGYSKGKNKYYLYYRCNKDPQLNFRGEKMHEMMEQVLEGLSYKQKQIDFISITAQNGLKEALGNRRKLLESKRKDLANISHKGEKMEQRLIDEEIELVTYQKWFRKLWAKKGAFNSKLKI